MRKQQQKKPQEKERNQNQDDANVQTIACLYFLVDLTLNVYKTIQMHLIVNVQFNSRQARQT